MTTSAAVPHFGEWLSQRVGGKWCVAQRLTPRLREKGHAVAITPRRYADLQVEWEREAYGAPLKSLHEAAPRLLAALRKALDNKEAALHARRPPHNDLDLAREIQAAIATAEGR